MGERDDGPGSFARHLNHMFQGLEELLELVVAVVGDAALSAEVTVVSRDEFVEEHSTAGLRFEQIDDFS